MSRLHRGRELLRNALARRGAGPAARRRKAGRADHAMPRRARAGRLVSQRAAAGRDQSRAGPPSRDLSGLSRGNRRPPCAAGQTPRGIVRAEELAPRPEFAAELRAKLRPSQPAIIQTLGAAIVVGDGRRRGPGGRRRGVRPQRRLRDLAWPRWRATRPAITRTARSSSVWLSGRFGSRMRAPLRRAVRRAGDVRAAARSMDRSRLLERHACVYQGRRFGHVVFRYRGALDFAAGHGRARRRRLRSSSRPTPAPRWRRCRPAGSSRFVVADLDRQQVLRLAQTLSGPLSRHLA